MFSEASVILFTGGLPPHLPPQSGDPNLNKEPPGQRHPPRWRQPSGQRKRTWDQTGIDIIHPQNCHLVAITAAIGTHPTGIHSCKFVTTSKLHSVGLYERERSESVSVPVHVNELIGLIHILWNWTRNDITEKWVLHNINCRSTQKGGKTSENFEFDFA